MTPAMTPMSPSNPFEESTNPFESEPTADVQSSLPPQVEVCAFTGNYMSMSLVCIKPVMCWLIAYPLKHSGVGWLHFKEFSAIQV